MGVFIDRGVRENCWNLIESYGEICVHCGCCSDDPLVRAKARIEVILRRIEELENFHEWSKEDGLCDIQKQNITNDLEELRTELQKYKEQVEGLTHE